MSEFLFKLKLVCVRKEEAANPDDVEEKQYISYFKHKNSSETSVIGFRKQYWDMLKLGKEYWYEIREVKGDIEK